MQMSNCIIVKLWYLSADSKSDVYCDTAEGLGSQPPSDHKQRPMQVCALPPARAGDHGRPGIFSTARRQAAEVILVPWPSLGGNQLI
jgi:hypothetical protein